MIGSKPRNTGPACSAIRIGLASDKPSDAQSTSSMSSRNDSANVAPCAGASNTTYKASPQVLASSGLAGEAAIWAAAIFQKLSWKYGAMASCTLLNPAKSANSKVLSERCGRVGAVGVERAEGAGAK